MTIDVPYYTGLVLVTGAFLVPIIGIVCLTIITLNRKKN